VLVTIVDGDGGCAGNDGSGVVCSGDFGGQVGVVWGDVCVEILTTGGLGRPMVSFSKLVGTFQSEMQLIGTSSISLSKTMVV
jgi:hypothetical protein